MTRQPSRVRTRRGSLIVVGVGITGAPQTTLEAVACMTKAEKLFHLVVDPATELWVSRLNPTASSLRDLYGDGKLRRRTYRDMADRIVSAVEEGLDVCAAFYGHPGVFVHASHWAVRRARRAGYPARMLPGISADACLYADLSLNPGDRGIQSFEATDFLLYRRRFDPTSELLLWQVGAIGEITGRRALRECRADRLAVLTETLTRAYPATHTVVLYEAPSFPGDECVVRRLALARLPSADIRQLMTLYVPPLPPRDPDPRIVRWLATTPAPQRHQSRQS